MSLRYCERRCLTVSFLFLCSVMMSYMFVTYQFTHKTYFKKNVFSMYSKAVNRLPLTYLQKNNEVQPRGIPKIIHQIWNDESIPEVFQENIRGLVAHNKPPNWAYYFWTIETGTRFIKKAFPYLLERYSKAANLLKADILRLAVLHKYGGVYFDLDTVSVKPLDPFVEAHNCSLVTDPDEHTFFPEQPRKMLLITNSAMLCKPMNWFIREIMEKIASQSPTCKEAIQCTGPYFISKHYEHLQGTNKSAKLPIIVDNRYFEDMVDAGRHHALKKSCNEPLFSKVKHNWAKEICRNWIKRGREKRNISDLAYTYHTWFHTYFSPFRMKKGTFKNIKDLVQNVTFYKESIPVS